MHTHQRLSTRVKAGAAALLAAGLLLASVAPSSAATRPQGDEARVSRLSTMHHHFYRGVSRSQAAADRAGMDDSMMAVSDGEAASMDEATAYCADRFRSYDPSTGSYLGYDGNEHACP